jgi:hypothetical protein
MSLKAFELISSKNGNTPKTPKKPLRGHRHKSKKVISKEKRQISHRGVRKKGHQFERDIAIALRSVFPDARRHLENHKDDAAKGIDIVNTGYYRIQCKRMRKPAPLSAIKQVKCDELTGDVPVLITQGDLDRILVALPFEEFLRLVRLAGV